MSTYRSRFVAVIIAAAAYSVVLAPGQAPASGSPLTTLPFGFSTCGDCSKCGEGQHQLEEGTRHDGFDEQPHDCEEGSCSVAHGLSCPPAPEADAAAASLDSEAVKHVWESLTNPDVDIRQTVEAFDGKIFYNAERQAVQGRGCTGGIIVSFPLSEDQIARLAQ